MKQAVAVAAATLVLPWAAAVAVATTPRQATLLELQRANRTKLSPAFSASSLPDLNLQGFCRRIDCTTPECEPVCTKQPCCCWSSFAADKHPDYPSPEETAEKQTCLFPPEGFKYAPEPGLSYDDGYREALKKQNLPVYKNRRLCCLRRANGVQDESQRDLSQAVPTTTTTLPAVTTTVAEPGEVPEPGEVDPAFSTKIVTTSLMNPGDEYENAQMEEAARKHLAAAEDLQSAVSALNSSATAIQEVDGVLQTDPNLVRSREHVAQMRTAINNWAVRRWVNLKKLSTGDASSFDAAPPVDGPAPPPGLT